MHLQLCLCKLPLLTVYPFMSSVLQQIFIININEKVYMEQWDTFVSKKNTAENVETDVYNNDLSLTTHDGH